MYFLWRSVVKIFANAGALWAATTFIPGFSVGPVTIIDITALAISPLTLWLIVASTALALANAVSRPLLKVFNTILPFIPFLLLAVVFKGSLLYVADYYLPEFTISGSTPLLIASLLFGVVNAIF